MLFSKRYKESKTIGSILLISGTTVGAGMLAMPLTAMGVGYLLSFVLLVIMWFVMYSAAILQSELFKNEPIGISFATLVERVIGKRYKIIPAIMKSLLFFGLLSAYMTAASSVMVQLFNIPFFTSSVLFSLFLGMVIYKETQKMDHINRIFVVLKFSLFFIVMVILFNQINFSNFPVFESSSDVNFLILSIPMFFTSFGFHGSIPNIVEFLKDDQRALKKVFFIGSIIPLMVYILWITATFGSAYSCGQLKITQNTDLGTFLSHISACTSHPTLVNGLLQWFSFLFLYNIIYWCGCWANQLHARNCKSKITCLDD
jgi:tyrosine-specific transport protein